MSEDEMKPIVWIKDGEMVVDPNYAGKIYFSNKHTYEFDRPLTEVSPGVYRLIGDDDVQQS